MYGNSKSNTFDSSGKNGVDRLNTSLDNFIQPTRQPVYANAPPKPKRLNNSSESSPEPSTEASASHINPGNINPERRSDEHQPSPWHGSRHVSNLLHSTERRTPDVYGATHSKADYEEIYDVGAEEDLPPQPSGQVSQNSFVDKGISNGGTRDSYASNRSTVTRISEELVSFDQPSVDSHSNFSVSFSNHPRRKSHIPRPHSADFLEYDRSTMACDDISFRNIDTTIGGGGGVRNQANPQQPLRSQSSMGHEIDYWSEENYAQKMRQSSLYQSKNLSKTYGHGRNFMGPRVPPAGAATPDLYSSAPTPPPPNPRRQSSDLPTEATATTSVPNSCYTNSSKPHLNDSSDHRLHSNSPNFAITSPVSNNNMVHTAKNEKLNVSCSNSDSHTSDTLVGVEKHNTSSTSSTLGFSHGSDNSFSRSASARLPKGRRKDESLDSPLPDDPNDPDNKKVYQVIEFFL